MGVNVPNRYVKVLAYGIMNTTYVDFMVPEYMPKFRAVPFLETP